ncbi:hypothetical protein D3C84_781540 [compost metagenome]
MAQVRPQPGARGRHHQHAFHRHGCLQSGAAHWQPPDRARRKQPPATGPDRGHHDAADYRQQHQRGAGGQKAAAQGKRSATGQLAAQPTGPGAHVPATSGALRSLDQPDQPSWLQSALRRKTQPENLRERHARGAVPRHRPLQADQRQPWPRCRR